MAKKRDDSWHELCSRYLPDDGFETRPSGPWAEEKLWIWHRYVTITTNAMVGHRSWPAGLTYIDLFAGPGICRVRDSDRRLPGSPLIAANAKKSFRSILLCEKSPTTAEALRSRMDQSPAAGRYQVFVGDCNESISTLCRSIPEQSLCIAFVDPTGLHVKLETLTELSKSRSVDLLILFPEDVDVIRNVEAYYLPTIGSNLDHVLGADSEWRDGYRRLGSCDAAKTRRFFATLYIKQLIKHAGYRVFDWYHVRFKKNRPLYRLIYASRHQLGLKFFEQAKLKHLSGQKELDF